MKRKFLRKILLCILAISMLLTATVIPTFAISGIVDSEDVGFELRLLSIFNAKLSEMEAIDANEKLRVSNIKEAVDFAGNEYYIAECAPTGYMIFNADTGVFAEYSPSALSPYLGCSEDLYYCGPTFYYVEGAEGDLEHLIASNEIITGSEKTDYIESCQQYYNTLVADTNQLVVNYLDGQYGNQSFVQVATAAMYAMEEPQDTTYGYLENYEFFFNMEGCGYYCPPNSGGICGYIGLGMLIAYKEKYNSSANYMDDSYWSDATHNNLKGGTDSLAWHLRRNHGSEDGTYSTTIKEVSESYFSRRGVTVNHVSKWWGFFNNDTIMDSIDADNPVLLFGSLFNPQNENDNINHAVVVYKYTDHSGLFGETKFTTHYGWDGYENIYVSGTFGSIYILE